MQIGLPLPITRFEFRALGEGGPGKGAEPS